MSHVTATVHLEGREVTVTLPVRITRYANRPTPEHNDSAAMITEAARLALEAINSKDHH